MAHPDAANLVDDVIAQARRAHELGVGQVWLAQQQSYDAIALAALVGPRCPGSASAPRWCRSTRVTR